AHISGAVGTSDRRLALLSAGARGLRNAPHPGAGGGDALDRYTAVPCAVAAELEAYEPGAVRHRARRAPSSATRHSTAPFALRLAPGPGCQPRTGLVALSYYACHGSSCSTAKTCACRLAIHCLPV